MKSLKFGMSLSLALASAIALVCPLLSHANSFSVAPTLSPLKAAASHGTVSSPAVSKPVEDWDDIDPHETYPTIIPESSMPSTDGTLNASTHFRILGIDPYAPGATPFSTNGMLYNTPSWFRPTYALPATGGSEIIAIVDAFDYPRALSDFNVFSDTFGLPTETLVIPPSTATKLKTDHRGGKAAASNAAYGPWDKNAKGIRKSVLNDTNTVFQVVYASGTAPKVPKDDAVLTKLVLGWNLEAALDIEWAHAISPSAKIILVEADSQSLADLMAAVKVASAIPGVKEVSMSWGMDESALDSSTEAAYDKYFTQPSVVYLAASGDTSNQISYPACSANVIAVGGTTLNIDYTTGNVINECVWTSAGCGPSSNELRPSFQDTIKKIIGAYRTTSDISADADPNTGVLVYNSTIFNYIGLNYYFGWNVVGGTSLACPVMAGVLNLSATAGTGFATGTADEGTRLYSNLGKASIFNPISKKDLNANIVNDGSYITVGGGAWNYATGVGTPNGLSGK